MLKKVFLSTLIAAFIGGSVSNGYAVSGRSSSHLDHRSQFKKLHFLSSTQLSPLNNSDLDDRQIAWNFLEANHEQYGLPAGLSNLKYVETKSSLLGSHVYFQQLLNGIPVQHGQIAVSVSQKNNSVYKVYNNTYPVNALATKQLALNATKKMIGKEAALDIAWQNLKVHGSLRAAPKTRQVYVPVGEGFRLVFLVDVGSSAPFGHFRHHIDAYSGEIISTNRTEISRKPFTTVNYQSFKGKVWDKQQTIDSFLSTQKATAEKSLDATTVAANGTGEVFDPDPVTSLENSSLSDTSPASDFTSAYFVRDLLDITLSGSVYSLTGPWVTIADFESPNTAPSTTTTGNWTATRGDNAFNDAMTYFHVDQNQRYIQSLGYTGTKGIQEGSIEADSDGVNGDDNSHFIPSTNQMAFGHGCVDDNEDAFVIIHEYGHAIQHSIAGSNWSGGDTGAMGEGFCDYWAGSYRHSTPNGASFNPAWAFPWDGHNSCWGGRNMDVLDAKYDHSVTYTAHQSLGTYQSDELWSTPLFQAFLTLRGQGVPRTEIDQIILESHFGIGSGLKMRDMAKLIVTTAENLFPSGNHAQVFQEKFEAHNILVAASPGEVTENFSDSVAQNAWIHYGPFDTQTGTDLTAVMGGGSGDPDLYVKVGAQPTTSSYDCRPYVSGTNETCTVTAGGLVYVSVRGYTAGSYDLAVTYTP